MFDATKVSDSLEQIVGFRQPFNPEYAILDADNQVSRSGLFATDNEYCKIEFLRDAQDFAEISDADFNTYLDRKKKDSIINVCNAVFDKPSFIYRDLFYKHEMNKVNLITLPSGFVGFKIEVSQEKNIAISIKRVLLDFSGLGDIKLMLFNTAKAEPLFTKDITIASTHQEVVLDWVLNNTESTYKGDYYLGYNTDGIVPKPFARDYGTSNIISSFTELNIRPIQVLGHNTELLFDLNDVDGMSDATGLNFDMTVFDDYTDLIINNEHLFQKAINYEIIIGCLQTISASIGSNRNTRMGEQTLIRMLAEIEGQSGEGQIKIIGLRPRLFGNIKRIKKEIQSLQEGYFGGPLMVSTVGE